MSGTKRFEEFRDKLGDFWFAVKSDRRTIPCYRDLRDNKKALGIYKEIQQERSADSGASQNGDAE